MDWVEAAKSIPPLESRDLLRFGLASDEQNIVMTQFNKALKNAQSDSADIAAITLKKLLTRFPEWGEAAVLYGICLAMDGKLTRAQAVFQHALEIGIRSEKITYLAQVLNRDAANERSARQKPPEEINPAKVLIGSVIPKPNPMVQEENQIRPRTHMQAPILMKASRHSSRAKLATDRERRELLMQSTSSNGELPDDEIDVSIPKTPAEKLRITLVILGIAALLTGMYFLTTLWILPAIEKVRDRNRAEEKLEYLTRALYEKENNPEIAGIISDYEASFSETHKAESVEPSGQNPS